MNRLFVFCAHLLTFFFIVGCSKILSPIEEYNSGTELTIQGNYDAAFMAAEVFRRVSGSCWDAEIKWQEAIVLNSPDLLNGIIAGDGTTMQIPEIDFNLYSLVVGYCACEDGGYRIKNHYIKYGKAPVLYVEMSHHKVSTFERPTMYIVGLYPKLPDGPIRVKRIVHEQ